MGDTLPSKGTSAKGGRTVTTVVSGIARQFVTYAGVGVIGTIAQYSTLLGFVECGKLSAVQGSAVGYVVGALVNYILNHTYTYRSSLSHGVALPKFMTVAAVGFCINALIMMIGTQWLLLNYLFVQVLATGAVLFWGFVANLLWTFKWNEHDHK